MALGLEHYGPGPSLATPAHSKRYPSTYEIEDVLATAHEMGATVVRSQTMGDTVGCASCIEPKLGQFNEAAFAQMDRVVAEARKYGIKIFGEFDCDANSDLPPLSAGTIKPDTYSDDWWCYWEKITGDCNRARDPPTGQRLDP